ncbi:nitrilase-related carbon-nitrogen hydrolase [Cohnella caldifontis]|uniref:nitrilase-related carbon-nitrogen hydrolase n=1 Tax=Cohnella caldifontis TaxID=3027471 RepID=UPI0023ED9011|nr:nitrilase-related carbon-nitrogen hydrolase [Cohnella sp. YIM B05605]
MRKPMIPSNGLAAGLAVLSGILFACCMPGTGAGPLAWFAFVPLLLAARGRSGLISYTCFNLTGVIGSVGIHIWYPDILGQGFGLFLMLASGLLYGSFLQFGYALQEKFRSPLKALVLPAVWTALEWLRFSAPVTGEWWIEVLAKSQWLSPAPLQLVSLTGFAGLSFVILLTNNALAELIAEGFERRRLSRSSLAALLVPIAVWTGGLAALSQANEGHWVRAAAHSDMVNQDSAVQKLGGHTAAGDGYVADTPEMSAAIFDINAELTKQAAGNGPSFIVWGENEFAEYGTEGIDRLKHLAADVHAYIAADVTWRSGDGLHDTALLVGPDGREVGKTAKIQLTDGEKTYGFIPGSTRGQVFETSYGKVGLAVCWDRHVTGIVRALAANGARLMLIPVDDDFNGNAVFPRYAASDTVFRAVENRVAIVTGSTSGMSQIVTPYGLMAAASPINERTYITGETVLGDGGRTLYNRWGDWFAWVGIAFVILLLGSRIASRRSKS